MDEHGKNLDVTDGVRFDGSFEQSKTSRECRIGDINEGEILEKGGTINFHRAYM